MTESDYVAANRDWLLGAIFNRKRLVRLPLFAMVMFVCGLVLAWTDGASASGQIIYGLCLVGAFVALMALLWAITYLLMPRRAGRLFKQQTALHRPLTIAWSHDGMIYVSANGEGRYNWSDLHRWSDAKSAILIYHTDQLFFVVPRRTLEPLQIDDLLNTLTKFGPPRLHGAK